MNLILKLSFVFPLVLGVSSCAAPSFKIDGEIVSPNSVSRIFTMPMADSFFGNYAATIEKIDDSFPSLVVRPGEHIFLLSYSKTEDYMIPSMLTVKKPIQAYEVKLNTKPSMVYIPIFDHSPEDENKIYRLCVVEVPQTPNGIINLNNINQAKTAAKNKNFTACASRVIPSEEAMKLCQRGGTVNDCQY